MRSLILIATLAATLFSLAGSARAEMCTTSCYGNGQACVTRCQGH